MKYRNRLSNRPVFYPLTPTICSKNTPTFFLDLDGTVTDSMEGITKSIRYALKHFGIEVNDLNELRKFVGPLLKESLMEFCHFSGSGRGRYPEIPGKIRRHGHIRKRRLSRHGTPSARIKRGRKTSNARYRKTGLLRRKDTGSFPLERLLQIRRGSGLDGSLSHKDEVIRHVLENNDIRDLSKVVMVGDRKHDIIGARKTGIDCIGVLYGYGIGKN